MFQVSFAVDPDQVAGPNKRDSVLKHVIIVVAAAFVMISCVMANRKCLKWLNQKPVVQRAASRLTVTMAKSKSNISTKSHSEEAAAFDFTASKNKACEEPPTIVEIPCPEVAIDIMPPDTSEVQQSQQTAPPPEIRIDIEPPDGPDLQESRQATPSVSSISDNTSDVSASYGSDSTKPSPSLKGAKKSRASVEKKDKKKKTGSDQKNDVSARSSVATASAGSARLLAVPSKPQKHRKSGDSDSRAKRNEAEDVVPSVSRLASQTSSASRPSAKRTKDKGTFQTN